MYQGEEIFEEIDKRSKKLGDLPIFSATINRIQRVSADPDSNAMALSMEASKDANLTTKLLTLANSSYYNRGVGKIGVISRAIVLLGFSTVKNICLSLKLVDSFNSKNPAIDMNRLLVCAYLAAGFVREVALKAGLKDAEESYTCALLHNLGKIIVAYFLPEKFVEIQQMMETDNLTAEDAEKKILGKSIYDIGQRLATNWEFPSNIVKTMEPAKQGNTKSTLSPMQLNRSLSATGNTVVMQLYNPNQTEKTLPELLTSMGELVGLDHSVIEKNLAQAFELSCDLAEDFGLKKEKLMPDITLTGDELRDRISGRFAYLAGSKKNNSDEGTSLSNGDNIKPTITDSISAGSSESEDPNENRSQLQLETLQEISNLIADNGSLNVILSKILEGLVHGVGLSRSALCLLSPDFKSYAMRMESGSDTDKLKKVLSANVKKEKDIFSQTIFDGNSQFVSNCRDSQWSALIREDFETASEVKSFIICGIHMAKKPIGFFYADNYCFSHAITKPQREGFLHFASQAKIAFLMSNKN